MLLVVVSQPLVAQAPNPEEIISDRSYCIIQNVYILPISPVNTPSVIDSLPVLRLHPFKEDIIRAFELKAPDLKDLLIFMIEDESGWCSNLHGDNGLAYGCFQIHIDKHDITEACAMDFYCSLDFTIEHLRKGNCYLWTACRKYYNL